MEFQRELVEVEELVFLSFEEFRLVQDEGLELL